MKFLSVIFITLLSQNIFASSSEYSYSSGSESNSLSDDDSYSSRLRVNSANSSIETNYGSSVDSIEFESEPEYLYNEKLNELSLRLLEPRTEAYDSDSLLSDMKRMNRDEEFKLQLIPESLNEVSKDLSEDKLNERASIFLSTVLVNYLFTLKIYERIFEVTESYFPCKNKCLKNFSIFPYFKESVVLVGKAVDQKLLLGPNGEKIKKYVGIIANKESYTNNVFTMLKKDEFFNMTYMTLLNSLTAQVKKLEIIKKSNELEVLSNEKYLDKELFYKKEKEILDQYLLLFYKLQLNRFYLSTELLNLKNSLAEGLVKEISSDETKAILENLFSFKYKGTYPWLSEMFPDYDYY